MTSGYAASGAELLAQVRAITWPDCTEEERENVWDALDGCVLLTGEEAEKVRLSVCHLGCVGRLTPDHCDCGADEALVLLGGSKP